MLLLSTTYDDVSVRKDERLKPSTICFYHKSKGAVDVIDMKIEKYAKKMKTKRWSPNTFTYELDTCRTNGNTTFQEATGQILSTFE